MSSPPPTTSLRALFFSDLVGSAVLVERLGDQRSAIVLEHLDRVARELMARHGGREFDRTDGYLWIFERPADAVRCALELHAAVARASAGHEALKEHRTAGGSLAMRAGIHLGELLLRENPPEEVARGARPLECEGLAITLCARLTSLAEGGQTLLTRGAFDLARRGTVGDASLQAGVRWLAHGPYLFKGVEEPVEVFEAGVEGSAPLTPPRDGEKARRAVALGDDATLGWRPATGLSIPLRANWQLSDRLGEGGFGEVWLARHVKTHESRVFKFCFDVQRLRGLKREVTLFRLLKESLGEREDIARVLDWNFDEAPYFIESEHTGGGNLIDWAAAQGGLGSVPLETRLELVAQVAEALGAAHSVGVLHKDIKPSNVLVVEDRHGHPLARLTDFGIGAITDRARLAQAGVTATGLTEATLMANDSSRTGTRLYMAPEMLEGRPATIQSDIFALGVVLFQCLTGDFRRALPSDWRDEVADEILRDDVAACVAGDPARRLAGAARLAERIRNREFRREELLRDRRLAAEVEAARGAVERARRLRRVLLAICITGMIVITTVSWLALNLALQRKVAESNRRKAVAARTESESARDDAEELVGFMLGDLRQRLEPIGRLGVMDAVAERARIYYDARGASAGSSGSRGRRATALSQLAELRYAQGRSEEAFDLVREGLAAVSGPDAAQPAMLAGRAECQLMMGRLLHARGKLSEAETAYHAARGLFERLVAIEPEAWPWRDRLGDAWAGVGDVLAARGRLDEALAAYESDLHPVMAWVAADPENAAAWRRLGTGWNRVGGVRQSRGNLEDARAAYETALAALTRPAGEGPPDATAQREACVSWIRIGDVLMTQGRHDEARASYEKRLTVMQRLVASDPSNATWQRELGVSWNRIGGLLEGLGHLGEAHEAFESARRISDQLLQSDPANRDWQRDLSVAWRRLGGVLAKRGSLAEARAAFEASRAITENLADSEPTNAGWQGDLGGLWSRIGGVLASEGRLDEARAAFEKTLELLTELTTEHPANLGWQSDLGIAWLRLGEVHASAGETDQALAAIETGRDILDRLAATDPTNAAWQHFRGIAWTQIGGLHAHTARLEEARAACDRGTELLRPLLGVARPASEDHRAWSLNRLTLGRIERADDDDAGALDAWREGIAVLTPLVEAGLQGGGVDPSILDPYVTLLIQVGRVEEARPHLDRLRDMGYRDPALWALVAEHGIEGPPPPAPAPPGE